LLVGSIVDRGSYTPVFILVGIMAPLAAFLFFALMGPIKRVTAVLGLTLLCLTVPASAWAQRREAPQAPRTILARGEQLLAAKREFATGGGPRAAAFRALLDSARDALAATPLSVMQKKNTPSSGDKHDYVSMAPYWWPDTTKPDGLPFIRRDGEIYPESRLDHDGLRLQRTIARVQTLALAWYFTGEARYAQGAARHVRTFFLDTATRMNPNLRFAQAVLGRTDGRGIGIIDTRTLPDLVDALRILDAAPGWSAKDRDGMVTWCRAYLAWLIDSKNGTEERAAENNHGTFYDEQVAALALFVGDSVVARRTLDASAKARIASQIDSLGKQKLELERTRPLHYSVFNLDAFTMLAEMGRHVGVDLWHYTAPNGGSILRALTYVAPYADPAVRFPLPEIAEDGPPVFPAPMRRAMLQSVDPRFAAAVGFVPERLRVADAAQFAFPAARTPDLDALATFALDRAAAQVLRSATALDPSVGYPRATDSTGAWTQGPATWWTSGFFSGTLWYLYQREPTPAVRALAERWMAGLEPNKTRTTTHDLGFMVFNPFGHAFMLTGDAHDKDVVLEASRTLVRRFDPKVGAIKSWDTQGGADARRDWAYPVIIDNLMNLEMLFWASAHGGDPAWAKLAEQHALTSAKAHVRADGSTAHVALFDPATGRLEKTVTWQGYADSSTWSRGQAWAVYGFTAAYQRTQRPELLRAARATADWFIAHLPADGVPYWDFRHPGIPNTERDASAGAIAASGLYDLARLGDAATRSRYRAAADRLLRALIMQAMAPESPRGAVLAHSTGGRPFGSEVDVGLAYADYYFVEALLRRGGRFLPK
jgi:hypothetical protein